MSGLASYSGIRDLMERYELLPRKKWGQNFLFDQNIIRKIVDSCELTPNEYVLEIGPGLGALTREFAQKSQGVMAVDIDRRLEGVLNEVLSDYDNFRILFADILKVDIEEEFKKAFCLNEIPAYQVCANIPYYITTPIIFRLLENCPHMQSATLMMQREVAARIIASPGGKDYGLLSIMTAYYCEPEFLMKVSRNCFYPRPEVESTVIRIRPLREKRVGVKDELLFKNFLRLAFQRRRKTILNICSEFFSRDKHRLEKQLRQIGIAPLSRPETLSIEAFALLVDTLQEEEDDV